MQQWHIWPYGIINNYGNNFGHGMAGLGAGEEETDWAPSLKERAWLAGWV